MTARHKTIFGRAAVNVEGRLNTHQQLDRGAGGHADGTGLAVGPVVHLTPVVTALRRK